MTEEEGSDLTGTSEQDQEGSSHLDDLQLVFAALHAAERAALGVGVMDGDPGAADELPRVQRPRHGLDLQRLPQGATVAGGVHHHGLGAGVDLRLHHGDLQDVRDGRLLPRGPRAGLGQQLGGGLGAAERRRWAVGGATEGDLGDGGALRDDWLQWRRFIITIIKTVTGNSESYGSELF